MMGGSQQSAAFVLTVSAEMTGRHIALDPETFSTQKPSRVYKRTKREQPVDYDYGVLNIT